MFERFFNPAPTFYKWDRFWVGFWPALFLPLLSLLALCRYLGQCPVSVSRAVFIRNILALGAGSIGVFAHVHFVLHDQCGAFLFVYQ